MKSNFNVKNIIRGCVSLLLLVCAFFWLDHVFLLKSEDGTSQMQSYYLQEEDTVDVLMLGSSHIYCDVNTGILWDEYGIAAYDLGGAEQPYWNSYYFLREALKTQRPKVIVLDVTIPGIRSVEYQPENWVVTNLYGMKWNKNRIDATKASTLEQSFQRLLFPMYTIHGRYNDLGRNDFLDVNRDITYKGFDYRDNTKEFERTDIEMMTGVSSITEKEEKYYRMIIELAEKENIPLLLVSVPFPVPEEAQEKYNYEFKLAEELDVPYIDFNLYYDDIGIDFVNDYADEFHLNISGNEKFTKYFGELLQEKYNLEDHRGDERYSSWDEDALNQRMEVADYLLCHADTLDEYVQMLDNDEYLVFTTNGASVSVMQGGAVLYQADDEEFSVFLDEGIDKMLFERTADSDAGTILYVNDNTYEADGEELTVYVYDRRLNRMVSRSVYDPEDGDWKNKQLYKPGEL